MKLRSSSRQPHVMHVLEGQHQNASSTIIVHVHDPLGLIEHSSDLLHRIPRCLFGIALDL